MMQVSHSKILIASCECHDIFKLAILPHIQNDADVSGTSQTQNKKYVGFKPVHNDWLMDSMLIFLSAPNSPRDDSGY